MQAFVFPSVSVASDKIQVYVDTGIMEVVGAMLGWHTETRPSRGSNVHAIARHCVETCANL